MKNGERKKVKREKKRYKYNNRFIYCEECKIRKLINNLYVVKNARLGN